MDKAMYDHFAELEPRQWWFQGRRRVVASVLAQRLAPPIGPGPRRIADLGCGTGELTDMLRAFGTVQGIDPAPEAVAHCRRRFGDAVDIRLGTIPEDTPPPGEVEVITAFDVIEHLDDDIGALATFYRSLPAGGTLVLTVPAFDFLWSAHDVIVHHRRRYTRPLLRARLAAAGFTLDFVSYFNTWLFPPVAAVRLLDPRRNRAAVAGGAASDDFTLPRPWLNRLLLEVFASERHLLRHVPLPVGVSIIAMAQRRGD